MTSDIAVSDPVKHPAHYTSHPSGVEIYLITQEMWCPNLANAFKYLARHEHKENPVQDLRKALEYVLFEIGRRRKTWFWLPKVDELEYSDRYAPFYVYVAHEPDIYIKNQLVNLWNADKSEHPKQLDALHNLGKWIEALANELEKRAVASLKAAEEDDLKEFSGSADFVIDKVSNDKLRLPMQIAIEPDENAKWFYVVQMRVGRKYVKFETYDGGTLALGRTQLLRARNVSPKGAQSEIAVTKDDSPIDIPGEFSISTVDMINDIDAGVMKPWTEYQMMYYQKWYDISDARVYGRSVEIMMDGVLHDVKRGGNQELVLRQKDTVK